MGLKATKKGTTKNAGADKGKKTPAANLAKRSMDAVVGKEALRGADNPLNVPPSVRAQELAAGSSTITRKKR
jgi:hypothetical protein